MTALTEWLASHEQQTVTLQEAYGLLFTLAACPVDIESDEWLPLFWQSESPLAFAGEAEEKAVCDELQAILEQQRARLQVEELPYPEECAGESGVEYGLWCRGMMEAHMWLDPLWTELYSQLPDSKVAELHDEVLSMAMTFSDPATGNAMRAAQGKDTLSPDMLPMCRGAFDDLLKAYAKIGLQLREMLV